MFDLKQLRAVGAMVAKQAREKAAAEPEAANDIIDMSPLLAPWKAGTAEKPVEHKLGDIVAYADMPWHCLVAHTHRGEPDWEPNGLTALWAQYHGRDAAHALPFRSEGHNPYNEGHWMLWTDGWRYRSTMNTNTWSPVDYPSGWAGPFDSEGNKVIV